MQLSLHYTRRPTDRLRGSSEIHVSNVSIQYSAVISISNLVSERLLNDNYPIRDANGERILLRSHEFPAYFSGCIILNPMSLHAGSFEVAHEVSVRHERSGTAFTVKVSACDGPVLPSFECMLSLCGHTNPHQVLEDTKGEQDQDQDQDQDQEQPRMRGTRYGRRTSVSMALPYMVSFSFECIMRHCNGRVLTGNHVGGELNGLTRPSQHNK